MPWFYGLEAQAACCAVLSLTHSLLMLSLVAASPPRWATAIEAAIGTALDAFLCHTAKDCKLVRELAIKSGVNMKLFTVYQVRFDLPPHR